MHSIFVTFSRTGQKYVLIYYEGLVNLPMEIYYLIPWTVNGELSVINSLNTNLDIRL